MYACMCRSYKAFEKHQSEQKGESQNDRAVLVCHMNYSPQHQLHGKEILLKVISIGANRPFLFQRLLSREILVGGFTLVPIAMHTSSV